MRGFYWEAPIQGRRRKAPRRSSAVEAEGHYERTRLSGKAIRMLTFGHTPPPSMAGWGKALLTPGPLWSYGRSATEFHVQDDRRSIHQQAGARHLMTAALTVLLLALAAVTGSSLSLRASSALLVMAGDNDRPAGLAIDDGERALTWARSASYTKSSRPQPLAFGGSTSKSAPEAALPSSDGFGSSDGTVALGVCVAVQHAAASGQSTSRVPTGPPYLASRAV